MSEVLHIDLEEGDLTDFDSTVTDGGDLSAAAAAALVGAYGLSSVIDDTTSIYGQKDYSVLTSTIYRYRFYFDPNALSMNNGDGHRIVQCGNGATAVRSYASINYLSDNYEINAFAVDDLFAHNGTSRYVIPDNVCYVEVRVQYASSAVASDGHLTLWIDNVQKEQVSSLDIFDISKPNNLRAGAVAGVDAATSGTYYLDDIILRDDDTPIGMVGNPWYAYANARGGL